MNDAPAAQRDYRDTVFLPQTSFPMRGDLPKREPQILARWEKMELWSRIRAASRPLNAADTRAHPWVRKCSTVACRSVDIEVRA